MQRADGDGPMTILEFVASIVTSLSNLIVGLAWPVLLACLVWLFREQIRRVLSNIKTLAAAGFSVDLQDNLVDAQVELQRGAVGAESNAASQLREAEDALLETAAPITVIVDSWAEVLRAVDALATRHGVQIDRGGSMLTQATLVQKSIIPAHLGKTLLELAKAKNQALHFPDNVPLSSARLFRSIALNAIVELDRLFPD